MVESQRDTRNPWLRFHLLIRRSEERKAIKSNDDSKSSIKLNFMPPSKSSPDTWRTPTDRASSYYAIFEKKTNFSTCLFNDSIWFSCERERERASALATVWQRREKWARYLQAKIHFRFDSHTPTRLSPPTLASPCHPKPWRFIYRRARWTKRREKSINGINNTRGKP